MMRLYRAIIDRYVINDVKCCKLLSKDGITTQELVIEKVEGIIKGIWIDARVQVPLVPGLGSACGILKNLDQYQYIVCSEIRSFPDSNPYKKDLQKYRITIIAAFAKFAMIIDSRADIVIREWIRFAQLLLELISDALVKARLGNDYARSSNISSSSMFDYFSIPEREVEYLLQEIY